MEYIFNFHLPDSVPRHVPIPHLIDTQGFARYQRATNALGQLRLPLFHTPLHYPITHPAYLPSMLCSPMEPSGTSSQLAFSKRAAIGSDLVAHYTPFTEPLLEQQDSKLNDKIKDNEVSSSEEAYKIDSTEELSTGNNIDQASLMNTNNDPNNGDVKHTETLQTQDSENIDEQARYANRNEKTHEEVMKRFFLPEPVDSPSRDNLLLRRLYAKDTEFEPSASVLMASIRWLHNISPFIKLAPTDQLQLLHASWRELFVLTAAQLGSFFNAGDVAEEDALRRPNIYEELLQLITVMKRICVLKLDKFEYDMLKMTILFRSEILDSTSAFQVQTLQDESLIQLQNLCSEREGTHRLGKVLANLASVCSLVRIGTLEHLLFGSSTNEDVQSVITHLLKYTSE